jgi:uncharacterized protein (DUF2336 family)
VTRAAPKLATSDLPVPNRSPGGVAPDEAKRVRQGADPHGDPAMLRVLAADRSVTVRAAVALNPASPPQVDQALAQDPDERVRVLLARRLAGLVPSLTGEEQLRLQRHTYVTLTALVSDAAVRVRAAVADVLKDMPQAPRGLILQLAHDREIMVSTPIIRFSPLLTTEDLLALIAEARSSGTVIAVAGRPGIDVQVSDAIAATSDSAAIRALLGNRTAQIREATLDALIARAGDQQDWHEPLVHRPTLPPRAARALAEIVATQLLAVLAQRADLPRTLAEELRKRLATRLDAGDPTAPRRKEPTMEEAVADAHALAREGRLNEDAALEAVQRGEARFAAALLAVAAGMPVSVVDRASSLRSAKGLVSLAWKAGFTMRAAVALQTLLGRLGPDATLPAGPGGGFPLAIEEMRWQLEFLGRMGR